MNSDYLARTLRGALESAGWQVNSEHHPGSLRVEFVVCPPMLATLPDLRRMVAEVYSSPILGQTVGDRFSSDHDCGLSYFRFRLESCPLCCWCDEEGDAQPVTYGNIDHPACRAHSAAYRAPIAYSNQDCDQLQLAKRTPAGVLHPFRA